MNIVKNISKTWEETLIASSKKEMSELNKTVAIFFGQQKNEDLLHIIVGILQYNAIKKENELIESIEMKWKKSVGWEL